MFDPTRKLTRTLLWLLVLCLALPMGTACAKQEPKPLVNAGDPINILVTYAPFDPKTDHSVVVLEEVLGYDIEFDMLPEQNGMDKLNLIFSSGDVPYDLINFNDKSLYTTYAKKNLLVDLTDELPKYENLMKLDPQGQEAIKINGRVYGVASTGLPYSEGTINIRMDWLEQLGLEIPTTREELYNVLVAFKEKDPGGLGEDLIPLIASPSQFIPSIATTFGFVYAYEERDGRIADMRLTQEYLDYLTFMNQLYNEKLLDPDMPVNIGSAVNEKVAAGRVGVHMGGTDQPRFLWVAEKEKNPDIAAPMDIIEPLKDSNGVQRASSLVGLHKIGIIPRTTQKLDMVLSFLNAFRDDANYEYIIHGDEGVDFEMVNGEPS
ncbi:MAG TPA: extracellular solute-binding protein, partial [Clostridia bacterium]|nr:extracellular solute-binding protein [Clostridia bacterium]